MKVCSVFDEPLFCSFDRVCAALYFAFESDYSEASACYRCQVIYHLMTLPFPPTLFQQVLETLTTLLVVADVELATQVAFTERVALSKSTTVLLAPRLSTSKLW